MVLTMESFANPHTLKKIEDVKQPYRRYIKKYCKNIGDILVLRIDDNFFCASLSLGMVIANLLPPIDKNSRKDKIVKVTIVWILPPDKSYQYSPFVKSVALFRGSTSKVIKAQVRKWGKREIDRFGWSIADIEYRLLKVRNG